MRHLYYSMEQRACTKFSEERKFAFDTFKLGVERGLNERNISMVKGKIVSHLLLNN